MYNGEWESKYGMDEIGAFYCDQRRQDCTLDLPQDPYVGLTIIITRSSWSSDSPNWAEEVILNSMHWENTSHATPLMGAPPPVVLVSDAATSHRVLPTSRFRAVYMSLPRIPRTCNQYYKAPSRKSREQNMRDDWI